MKGVGRKTHLSKNDFFATNLNAFRWNAFQCELKFCSVNCRFAFVEDIGDDLKRMHLVRMHFHGKLFSKLTPVKQKCKKESLKRESQRSDSSENVK